MNFDKVTLHYKLDEILKKHNNMSVLKLSEEIGQASQNNHHGTVAQHQYG